VPSHRLQSGNEEMHLVTEADYHEVQLEHVRVIGKLQIDADLTTKVQEKFSEIATDDINRNPSDFIDRLPPKAS
jgi:hypothetical protein